MCRAKAGRSVWTVRLKFASEGPEMGRGDRWLTWCRAELCAGRETHGGEDHHAATIARANAARPDV